MTLSEKIQDLMNRGIAASREAVSKAGTQAQVWGEMGVLKVEIIQYRSQVEKLSAQLGAEVYATFAEKGQKSLSAESPAVRDLIGRIRDTERAIEEKEGRFRKLGGKDADLDQPAG
ncbi:MAG TPA: hypothetical protein PLB91_16650 [Spirochaetales bacterium]|nr:hypothetical protein [Spirochaetales bacterium]HRY53412.1 hypothetical protein [Spirochaetia bacterium]HRZ63554.1 hypothetical protein [Spirochaetia bacterium]